MNAITAVNDFVIKFANINGSGSASALGGWLDAAAPGMSTSGRSCCQAAVSEPSACATAASAAATAPSA